MIYRACYAGGVLKRDSGENRSTFDASGVCPKDIPACNELNELMQFDVSSCELLWFLHDVR